MAVAMLPSLNEPWRVCGWAAASRWMTGATVDAEVMAAVNEGGSGGSQRDVVAVWRTRF